MSLKNISIQHLHDKMKRYHYELCKSVSAEMSHMQPSDISRLKEYVLELESSKAKEVAQPALDLSAWHRSELSLAVQDFEAYRSEENDDLNQLLQTIEVAAYELLNGQSRSLPQGLDKYDSKKFDDNMEYLKASIQHIENAAPTHRPESAVLGKKS